MIDEPDSLILRMLGEIRAEMATKSDLVELSSELHSLRADVAADLMTASRETNEKIVGLRRAVIEYHTSVIGHGIIISELEARIRRVEQHLNLPALTTS